MFEMRTFGDLDIAERGGHAMQPARTAWPVGRRVTQPVAPGAAGRILVVMHGEQSCPGRIGQHLVRAGYELDRRKPRFGCQLPTQLANYAGVVVFGGPMSANDPDSWLACEIALAAQALKENTPYLGVCLGGQILAKALGARVARHPEAAVEIGYYPITPTAAGARIGAWPAHVYHWHSEGFDVPAGAKLLAKGEAFPNQAYAFGRAIGLQFHPEITYALVNRWTTVANGMLGLPGAKPAASHLREHMLNAAAVDAWLARLLGHWLVGIPA
jgi:GMP synthase (glutamine-hydrolysing)